MDVITMIGVFAAGVSVVTMSMQTMVPLRIVGLASNFAFISYGLMMEPAGGRAPRHSFSDQRLSPA